MTSRKILAFALHRSFREAAAQVEKVKKFHRLKGKIVENEELEEKFGRKIERALKGEKPNLELERYRYSEVYRRLLQTEPGETITYGKLARETGVHVRQVVWALKFNPFPILIPCHRVVARNGIGGYTPLGTSFKVFLLEMEKDL